MPPVVLIGCGRSATNSTSNGEGPSRRFSSFNRVVENNDTLKVGFDKKDKGDQTIEIFNNQSVKIGTASANLLVTPVGGPDGSYNPLGAANNGGVNPWRYAYPGTNNPASYDLWIQLEIAGNTNLICNWTKTVQINNGSVP